MIKKVKKEDVETYIFDNEELTQDEIICPYCKCKQEKDPEFLYSERDREEIECEECGRKFLLSSNIEWWFNTCPIESEVKKILETEDVED